MSTHQPGAGSWSGSWFRGRGLVYDPDHQAIEQERQRMVGEQLAGVNDLIAERTVNRAARYRMLRAEYERTGDLEKLAAALEYIE